MKVRKRGDSKKEHVRHIRRIMKETRRVSKALLEGVPHDNRQESQRAALVAALAQLASSNVKGDPYFYPRFPRLFLETARCVICFFDGAATEYLAVAQKELRTHLKRVRAATEIAALNVELEASAKEVF